MAKTWCTISTSHLQAVVNNSNKWDYRLTVRSIVKQRNWKQRRNREPSRELYTKLWKRKVHKDIESLLKKSVQKSSRIYKLVVNYKATLASS